MIVETFWFIVVVPGGAEMILAIRAAAASTSGNQSLHAVIDLVRHSSKNSPRSSLAFAGTQPSECEMKWTHSSSAGNALRYSSKLSATGSAMAWLTTTAGSRAAEASRADASSPAEASSATAQSAMAQSAMAQSATAQSATA